MLSSNRFFFLSILTAVYTWVCLNVYNITTYFYHWNVEYTWIYEYLKIFSVFLHFVIKTRHFAATIVCEWRIQAGNIHDNSLKCTFVFGCSVSLSVAHFLFRSLFRSHSTSIILTFSKYKIPLADGMAGLSIYSILCSLLTHATHIHITIEMANAILWQSISIY